MADEGVTDFQLKKQVPCAVSGCGGTENYLDDEYGGLAGGGDYAVYQCDTCKKRVYVQLPD